MNIKTVEINDYEYPTYADLDDAEIYNNAIYGSTWSSLDEQVQSQLLVESTRVIDSYKYIGEKADSQQPLKFPRVTVDGKTSSEQVLIDLCCQIANYIYKNGSSSNSSSNAMLSNLKEFKMGDLQVNFNDGVSFDFGGLDDYIHKALEDWMISSSMQIWL